MQSNDAKGFMNRTIEHSLKQVPALPHAVMKVLEETEKTEPSASKVESIVTMDQAIVARLLKVVNSAYYGLPGQVVTVGQAITILGLQQVRNLVLGLAAFGAFASNSPRQGELLRTCWLHGLATASSANLFGKEAGLSPKAQDLAFIGGLMHDLGKLFLMTQLAQAYNEVALKAAKTQSTIEDLEERTFGMSHAGVGKLLVERWNFPEALCDLIGKHEGPLEETDSPAVFCVHLGDTFTKDIYGSPDLYRRLPDPIAISALHLEEARMLEITAMAKEKAAEALEQLGAAA